LADTRSLSARGADTRSTRNSLDVSRYFISKSTVSAGSLSGRSASIATASESPEAGASLCSSIEDSSATFCAPDVVPMATSTPRRVSRQISMGSAARLYRAASARCSTPYYRTQSLNSSGEATIAVGCEMPAPSINTDSVVDIASDVQQLGI